MDTKSDIPRSPSGTARGGRRDQFLRESEPGSIRNYAAELDYDMKEQIGRGAYSIVRRARHRKSAQEVAIKVIDKEENRDVLDMIRTEVAVMKHISNHPQLLQLIDVYETANNIELALELVAGGELFEMIVEKGWFQESDAAWMIRQVLEGLYHCHNRRVVHRDLKPENLLCTLGENGELENIVICDFGVATIIPPEEKVSGTFGSPDYISPEMHLEQPYTFEVDMWSVGIIAYIILAGYPPFTSDEDEPTVEGMRNTVLSDEVDFPDAEWSDVSEEAKDFIRSLLNKDPALRLTSAKALQHPFLLGTTLSDPVPAVEPSAVATPASPVKSTNAVTAPETPEAQKQGGIGAKAKVPGLNLPVSPVGLSPGSALLLTSRITSPRGPLDELKSPRTSQQNQRAQNFKKFTAKQRFTGAAKFFKSIFGNKTQATSKSPKVSGSQTPKKAEATKRTLHKSSSIGPTHPPGPINPLISGPIGLSHSGIATPVGEDFTSMMREDAAEANYLITEEEMEAEEDRFAEIAEMLARQKDKESQKEAKVAAKVPETKVTPAEAEVGTGGFTITDEEMQAEEDRFAEIAEMLGKKKTKRNSAPRQSKHKEHRDKDKDSTKEHKASPWLGAGDTRNPTPPTSEKMIRIAKKSEDGHKKSSRSSKTKASRNSAAPGLYSKASISAAIASYAQEDAQSQLDSSKSSTESDTSESTASPSPTAGESSTPPPQAADAPAPTPEAESKPNEPQVDGSGRHNSFFTKWDASDFSFDFKMPSSPKPTPAAVPAKTPAPEPKPATPKPTPAAATASTEKAAPTPRSETPRSEPSPNPRPSGGQSSTPQPTASAASSPGLPTRSLSRVQSLTAGFEALSAQKSSNNSPPKQTPNPARGTPNSPGGSGSSTPQKKSMGGMLFRVMSATFGRKKLKDPSPAPAKPATPLWLTPSAEMLADMVDEAEAGKAELEPESSSSSSESPPPSPHEPAGEFVLTEEEMRAEEERFAEIADMMRKKKSKRNSAMPALKGRDRTVDRSTSTSSSASASKEPKEKESKDSSPRESKEQVDRSTPTPARVEATPTPDQTTAVSMAQKVAQRSAERAQRRKSAQLSASSSSDVQ